MNYVQLKPANLSTKGSLLLCLSYARNVYNIPALYDCATDAWNAAKHKHTDALPNVIVPVWFYWYGSVGKIVKNWGHVAVYVPGKGVYTTPLNSKQPNPMRYDTVEQLAAAIGGGGRYLGWTEDINNVRVVEPGGNMASNNFITKVFQGFLGRDPDPGALSHYGSGQYSDPEFVVNDVFNSAEANNRRNSVAAAFTEATKVPGLNNSVASLQQTSNALSQTNAALSKQVKDLQSEVQKLNAQIANQPSSTPIQDVMPPVQSKNTQETTNSTPVTVPTDVQDSVTISKTSLWEAVLRFLGVKK